MNDRHNTTTDRTNAAIKLDGIIAKVCRKKGVEVIPSLGRKDDRFPTEVLRFIENAVSRAIGEIDAKEDLTDELYVTLLDRMSKARGAGRLDRLALPGDFNPSAILDVLDTTEHLACELRKRIRKEGLTWMGVTQKARG